MPLTGWVGMPLRLFMRIRVIITSLVLVVFGSQIRADLVNMGSAYGDAVHATYDASGDEVQIISSIVKQGWVYELERNSGVSLTILTHECGSPDERVTMASFNSNLGPAGMRIEDARLVDVYRSGASVAFLVAGSAGYKYLMLV